MLLAWRFKRTFTGHKMRIDFQKEKCFVIAGPCSAETRLQVLDTAEAISQNKKVHSFRAGVWKPRTRPGSFEGAGNAALSWLQEVQQKFGLPVTIEVAQPEHIEAALKHDINFFWIGARTTANPFSVQEIAEALEGVDCTVMVKNPIHPDLQLWIGAIERVKASGIKNVAAIHRGFHTSTKNTFRNTPMWQIPIELKVQFPDLPLICDPSHICGRRDLIFDVAQNAMDLGMNGLIIETHNNPDAALSDKDQQLSPAQLAEVLDKIKIKAQSTANPTFNQKLDDIRVEIDDIDAKILNLVKARLELVKEIANEKKDKHVAAFQLERYVGILKSRGDWANEKKLTRDFIEKLYQLIHEESIRTQIEIINGKK
jgi:chorismate mutase